MKREVGLLAGSVPVLAAAISLAAVVPGVLGQPETQNVQAGRLNIADITIAPQEVSGGTATLTVDARLSHSGGPSENVSVLFRATGIRTSLIETTQKQRLGTITGDREVTAVANLSVARARAATESSRSSIGMASASPPTARRSVASTACSQTTSAFPSSSTASATPPAATISHRSRSL